MENKVILMSIDGMRPDGLQACGNPFLQEMMKMGSYTFKARTVFPSVTLPCHMSMFHSVPPERHGILSNVYAPMVRPLPGLFEQISSFGGKCDMYYGWQPLRDIATPKTLRRSALVCARKEEDTDNKLTRLALETLREDGPDFMFLYQVETDEKGGHDNGWMTEAYLGYIATAIENVKRVLEEAGDRYTVILTADHGGHDRRHGTDMDEDMTIPMFFFGKDFTPGKELEGVSILDLAPTIVKIMGLPAAEEWEGKCLIEE